MNITKILGSLTILALLTTSVYAEAITAGEAATIVEQNIEKLTASELAEVNALVGELQASGLPIVGAEEGTVITAAQAAKVSEIIAIMTNNPAVAAYLSSIGITTGTAGIAGVGVAAGVGVGTLTAIGAAIITAIAVGTSGSSSASHAR